MGDRRLREKLCKSAGLLQGAVVLAQADQNRRTRGVNRYGERVQLPSPLIFRKSISRKAHAYQVEGVIVVGHRIIRIQLNCAAQLFLGVGHLVLIEKESS